ncbi:MAG TPA: TonB family protein [candidate division WOR-3 bacterium]|uniref:TonB family protein n=1 Tax=candidate division WOR-3 bacterium TaxID=2052148 RepID=A0A7V0XF13_UNCW3|nr:TonB family protein [candidate division WOR-3 bacterium]
MVRVLLICLLSATAGQTDAEPVLMPNVVGQALYPASRALRELGIRPGYRQVSFDTALVPEFHVVGQSPEAGSVLVSDDEVVLEFNCPGMLRYWDDWVLPLLGDFRQQVGFYRVQVPPEPIRFVGTGYPQVLAKYAFSGSCLVEALVDLDGTVLAVKVVESSGLVEADSIALDAALQATFHPAEHYEAPVRVWFPIPYHWDYREQLETAPERPGRDLMLEP